MILKKTDSLELPPGRGGNYKFILIRKTAENGSMEICGELFYLSL